MSTDKQGNGKADSLYECSSKIKDVFIELDDYKFFHSPFASDKPDDRFIGRKKVLERLKMLLDNSRSKSGAYLVTGFRGMGKTSLVRQAIHELNEKGGGKEGEDGNERLQRKKSLRMLLLFLGLLGAFCFVFTTGGDLLGFPKTIFFVFKDGLCSLFVKKSLVEWLVYGTLLVLGVLLWRLTWPAASKEGDAKQDDGDCDGSGSSGAQSDKQDDGEKASGFWYYFLWGAFVCMTFALSASFFDYSGFDSKDRLFSLLSLLYSAFVVLFCWWLATMLGFLAYDVARYWIKGAPANDNKRFKMIEMPLSQGEVNETDVFKIMARQLHHYWVERYEKGRYRFQRKVYEPLAWLVRVVIALFSSETRGPIGVVRNYAEILERLSELNRRIDAEVARSDETSISPTLRPAWAGGVVTLSMFRKRSYSQALYHIATPKEMEKELIKILELVDKYRNLKSRDSYRWLKFVFPTISEKVPEFAFVIDELDKIEPYYNYNIGEREAADPAYDNFDTGMFVSVRRRQEAILKLLGNIKSFLNVARAKFIFVGGREMYDSSLADIADRDSFYSSIFHDVIYINSFFKDKIEVRSGLTRMTEAYVCQLILPKLYLEKLMEHYGEKYKDVRLRETRYNLQTLFQYFLDCYGNNLESHKKLKDSAFKPIERGDELKDKNQIYKLLYLIQNYIIFLTYRSNGTPKKLANLVERYIIPGGDPRVVANPDDDNPEPRTVPVGKDEYCPYLVVYNSVSEKSKKGHNLFLRFNYHAQYEILLTANLYRPYIIINSRYLKAYGDKLLFSNAFILDHLMKFHAHGFSWRNLELIPEIILINKEPNLRGFIEDLTVFLSNTHIRPTINGLFQFKFYSLVSNELRFLSKISDLSSAAFNFTLDESLTIKRHYKKKLDDLQKDYVSYRPTGDENRYIHSIGMVQHILGDLHFYDKEFDDALIYYTNSIQFLRMPTSSETLTKHQVIILIRNQLKIGLTLEKTRAYDSAFSIYRSLILNIPRYLKSIVDKDRELNENSHAGLGPYRGLQLVNKAFIGWLGLVEKQRYDGISYANIRKNEFDFFGILDQNIASKQTHFYPYASISVYTRQGPEREVTDNYRINLLKADYLNNVGSLLFYKNKNFAELYQPDGKKWQIHELGVINYRRPGVGNKSDYRPSISSFHYYCRSLELLVGSLETQLKRVGYTGNPIFEKGMDINGFKYDTGIGDFPLFAQASWLLLDEFDDFANAFNLYHFGNLFSKLGDALLTFFNGKNPTPINSHVLGWFAEKGKDGSHSPSNDIRQGQLKRIIRWMCVELENAGSSEGGQEQRKPFENDISFVLAMYKIACSFFLKANRTYDAIMQYKKVLYVAKDFVGVLARVSKRSATHSKPFGEVQNPEDTIHAIAENAFVVITWAHKISNRPQILKYKNVFQLMGQKDTDNDTLFGNLANNPDIKEVCLLAEELKLKVRVLEARAKEKSGTGAVPVSSKLPDVVKELKKYATSPYSLASNKFVRMLELKFRCEVNYNILCNVLNIPLLVEYDFHPEKADRAIAELEKSLPNHAKLNKAKKEFGDFAERMKNFDKERKGMYEQGKQMRIEIEASNFSAHLKERLLYGLSGPTEKGWSWLPMRSSGICADVIGFYNSHVKALDEIINDCKQTRENLDEMSKSIKEDETLEKAKKDVALGYLKRVLAKCGARELMETMKKCQSEKHDFLKTVNFLICDSIFCLFEVIKTMEIYGNNYMASYSYLANAHYKLANWCMAFSNYKLLCESLPESGIGGQTREMLNAMAQDFLKELLGTDAVYYLEPNYHNELAIQYYHSAIQMHKEGRAYQDNLHKMHFLEDDFNDNLYHFCAASERFRINTDTIRGRIRKIKAVVAQSRLYRYDSYLPPQSE